MGCQALQSFLVKNKQNQDLKKIAGIIFGAPFFDFHAIAGVTTSKKMIINLLCKDDISHVSTNLYLYILVNYDEHWITNPLGVQ